jgi:hypothetical protein
MGLGFSKCTGRGGDKQEFSSGMAAPCGEVCGPCCGRFLVRLSDSLFFSSTERFRKKAKHRSKELREKRPNPGYVCFNAEGESFFERHKNFRVASLASE